MIISRYLTREVIQTLFAITIVLLLAFLSQQLVRYLNYVAIGKIATNLLLELVSFEIPYLLALLLPLALYLGVLLAYGRLYADNEMLILQMSGFGNKKLMRLTTFIAFVVALIVLFLMLWVNPLISAKREQLMESDEATLHLIQTLIPGRFQASPDGRHVMYVEKISRDHQQAENVFLAQEKKNPDDLERSAWMIVYADLGYQVKDTDSNDQLFVTANGYRYEGIPGQNDFKIIKFGKYKVRIPQNETQLTHEKSETLPTRQLLQQYTNPRHAAELQWRISIAVSAFLLALLAVPMSTVRPRQGRYLMLLPAVLIYIVYINLLFIARHWVEQGKVPISIGMWWVHGVILLFVLIVMAISSRRWTHRL
ncbi:MAG: LPS export ABC transporter permease LptF [Gammaproteobacteria bacterium]|nr:MAG: LPS export ABC transporter permease LptF [Gammaproteobacteria bacterium]